VKPSDLLARIRAKKPTAPAPVKRATRLTCGQLNRAVEAARASFDPTSSTAKTLERLYELTRDAGDEGAIVKLNGPPPVTPPELDAALTDVRDLELGLSASTLSALTKVRALLAQINGNGHAAEPAQYVTVSQAKALAAELHDLIAWVLGAMGEEFALSSPSRSHLLDLLGRSATGSPAREQLFRKIAAFKAADVPPRTQAEFLRYQVSGKWR
jgi:hypothetical protein